VLTRSDGGREEVDLEATGRRLGEGDEPVLPEPMAPSAIERMPSGEGEDGGGDAGGQ
jgi:hypothetical protein